MNRNCDTGILRASQDLGGKYLPECGHYANPLRVGCRTYAVSNNLRNRSYPRWAFCLTAPIVEQVARATSSILKSSTLSIVNTSRWLAGSTATRSSNVGRLWLSSL